MLLAPFDPMVCMNHDMVGKSKVEPALSTTLFCISTYADCQQGVKTARDASVHGTKGIKMNFKKLQQEIYSHLHYPFCWHWTAIAETEFRPFTFQPRAAACKSFLRMQTVYSGSQYFSSTLRVSL